MVGELSPLTLDEATELAGCLMTASTIERYSHALQNSRAARRLLSSLRTGTTDGTDLLRQGWRSRERVYQAPSRSEWELPLAAIISVLGQSGVSGTEDLLMAMATSHSPQSAWLSGLSRRILAHRTSSSIDASPLVARLPALADVRFDTESDLMLAQTRPRPASPFPQTRTRLRAAQVPSIYFVGVCLESIVDQRSNNVSLVHLIDQVQVTRIPAKLPFEIHVYAEFSETERGRPYHVRIVLDDRDGNAIFHATPTTVVSNTSRHRLISEGLPIVGVGHVRVAAEIGPAGEEPPQWVRSPIGWPLEITQGAPEESSVAQQSPAPIGSDDRP